MNNAEVIKNSLTMAEVAAAYGCQPNRAGFVSCPFGGHSDSSPSLKLYEHSFYCFGCGAGGSVIDFVMQMLDLSFMDAMKRLNADFHLGLALDKPADRRELTVSRLKREERQRRAEAWENWQKEAGDTLAWLCRWAFVHRPAMLAYFEDLHDVFITGTDEERAEFKSEMWEAVKAYARRFETA